MNTFKTIQQAKKYYSISLINHFNASNGFYFWSKNTKKFFKDNTSNYRSFVYPSGLVFIYNKATGKVRQVRKNFSISTTLNCMVDNKKEFDSIIDDLIALNEIDNTEVLFSIGGL